MENVSKTTQIESTEETAVVPAGRINSHNEWDRLREIIVGSEDGTYPVLTWANPEPMSQSILEQAYDIAAEAYPQWFIDEVNEDLEGLCATLKEFGVIIHRPKVHNIQKLYSSPWWSSTGNNLYNVRDLHLVIGNNVIESPSPLKSRYYEATALYDIWYEYMKEGFRWIAGPKPKLKEEALIPYYKDENERKLTEEDIRYRELTDGRIEKLHKLTETEILFEAANTLRMGKDLLYLVSCSGNYIGAKWLQEVLGDEYIVHANEDIYRSAHIDSTIMCLRPGLVLLNSVRVNFRNCPSIFDKWEKIWFSDVASVTEAEMKLQREVRDVKAKELEELGFQTNLELTASPWVGMNLLSLDPETVLIDSRQSKLISVLERYKFTVIPVRMRHIYTQGGGLHCATLDTVRDSKLESYFD